MMLTSERIRQLWREASAAFNQDRDISPLHLFAHAVEEAVRAGAASTDPVPSLESAVKLSLHQAAQWNTAVACAEREPHKPVVLEGRTVLAVHEALTRAS